MTNWNWELSSQLSESDLSLPCRVHACRGTRRGTVLSTWDLGLPNQVDRAGSRGGPTFVADCYGR